MSLFTPRNLGRAQKALGAALGYKVVKETGKVGKGLYGAYNRRMASARVAQGFYGNSSAVYQGKFRKPTRARPTKQTKYLTSGACLYDETYGDVSDPDCVYLGASTFAPFQMSRVIFYALIKKLYRKHGINLEDVNAEIPNLAYNDASGRTIVAIYKQPVNSTPIVTPYIMPALSTLVTMADANAANILNWMEQRIMQVPTPGSGYATDLELERVQLVETIVSPLGVITYGNVLAELNLKQEILQLEVSVNIMVQNRTKGATAGGTESGVDRVDNQPLVGKLYEFSGGVPKEKHMGNGPLNVVNISGVTLKRAAELTGSGYAEPPVAHHFSNITKCSGVQLQPGVIKRHSTKFYKRAYFNNWIKSMKGTYLASGTNAFSTGSGKSFLFAFEEILNSGSANKITVSYEVDRKTMAKFVTGTYTPMKTSLTQNVFSNIA